MTKFVSFLKDESGASAAEYVLILALVGIAIIGAASLLGTAMNDKLKSAADTIKAAS